MRQEHDALGELSVPATAYYGIHSLRAAHNFPFSGQQIHPEFIRSFAQVKHACAQTNMELGYISKVCGEAIATACMEIESGHFHNEIIVNPFQGGAGTSTNMNLNEVIANRANEILGGKRGEYMMIHPIHHVNMHQSTNDTYPTALKITALNLLMKLETHVSKLQETLQQQEINFCDIVKVGRTELTDAVPMTLGMTFGAFAEAVARDRWRIFKSRERLKKVNLGGTAIGTGLGAPREFILKATDTLKHIVGLPISRAENMVDATQNMDSFVEVSGLLKTYATNLMKISSDLRLLSSGPVTGIGEITLPPLQAGSSIMAGKINPVMPEAVTQTALRVMGNDQTITLAAALGQLELNHLLPLLAHTILESLTLLIGVTRGFAEKCIPGITANRERCQDNVEQSGALATVLVPALGYSRVERLLADAKSSKRTIREEAIIQGFASSEVMDKLLSPRRLCKLGFTFDEYCEVKNR
ncbi:aspartate ammonia-lyase [Pseudodesulfovibrio sediminis]|nr:aspartate ammonia-lyase [Pseudodesulfovibrio sediminis]